MTEFDNPEHQKHCHKIESWEFAARAGLSITMAVGFLGLCYVAVLGFVDLSSATVAGFLGTVIGAVGAKLEPVIVSHFGRGAAKREKANA
jgi:hypothetical protein